MCAAETAYRGSRRADIAPDTLVRMLGINALQRLQVGPVGFVLDRGACVSITGRSGSGKSMLLRMIADLDPHDGDCTLEGAACSAMPAPQWRRMVSYVAANAGWWAEGVAAHFPQGTDFDTLLPSVGIAAEAADWPVARLSTGERQRLALLRALSPDTRVLLLDEPTSGLDAASVALVESLLHARMAAGVAIILVTHDPMQAARMAARHFDMRDGKLAERTP